MTYPPRPHLSHRNALLLLTLMAAWIAPAACGGAEGNAFNGNLEDGKGTAASSTARPEADDVVLVVDGMEFTAGEISEFDAAIRGYHPAAGRATLARYVLASHVIPLRAAKRALAEKRAAAQAEASRYQSDVAGNSVRMLRETGATRGGYQVERKPLGNLSLPLQRWATAKENVYAISPVLEVPEGFQVASVYQVHSALSTAMELVDVYIVPFLTMPKAEFDEWWQAEQTRLSSRCTWVHPDYADSLPTWMLPPTTAPTEPPGKTQPGEGHGAHPDK